MDDVMIDNVFHIPASTQVQKQEQAVQTVALTSSMPVKIVSQPEKDFSAKTYKEIYTELNAASEEVLACRNAILENIS